MKKEIFKDIPGYEGLYQVSNMGNVMSFHKANKRLLKNSLNNGYYRVHLCQDGTDKLINIHVAMGITFLNYKIDRYKLVCDHINGIKTDNRLENLQIITHRNNLSKDRNGYSSKYAGVTWVKSRNKWASGITVNNKFINLGRYNNEIQASNAYQNYLNAIT